MKGAVGTQGRVTNLSRSLLAFLGWGGKGGFSETGESREEFETQRLLECLWIICSLTIDAQDPPSPRRARPCITTPAGVAWRRGRRACDAMWSWARNLFMQFGASRKTPRLKEMENILCPLHILPGYWVSPGPTRSR